MWKPHSTIMKARTGAQTIGSLTVSTSFAAKTEAYDVWDDAECCPSCATGVFSWGSFAVEPNARSRIVMGTTVRLMTRLAMATGIALRPPNRSQRTAGPTKGPAGAEAVSAASALVLTCMRKTRRENRNTTQERTL